MVQAEQRKHHLLHRSHRAAESRGTSRISSAADGNVIPIYDPLTGQQFECNGILNVICPERISPLSQTLIPYIPDPDRPGTGGGGLDNNKSFVPFINPNDQHVWGFTIDQILTQSQSLHFSMWHNSFHNFGFDHVSDRPSPNPLNSLRDFPARGSGYLLTYTNALTPHLAMTAGVGWIGEINNQFNHTSYNFPGVAEGIIPPNFKFDGQHALTNWGTNGSNTGSVNRKLGIAIVNNWLWTHGRHTFNIGGEFRRSYQDDNEEQTCRWPLQLQPAAPLRRLAITSTTTAAHLPASCWDFRILTTGPTRRKNVCATWISRRTFRTTSS